MRTSPAPPRVALTHELAPYLDLTRVAGVFRRTLYFKLRADAGGAMRRTCIGVAALMTVVGLAAPAGATFPGGNGKIAYYDFAQDPQQIYTIEPDGSSPTQITSGPRHSIDPAWSADGSKIAFTRAREFFRGTPALVTMNADGTGRTVIFRPSEERRGLFSPSWSPDGNQIVFCMIRSQASRRALYVINADGSGLTKITRGDHDDCSPSWSPDGTAIAFVTSRHRHNPLVTMDVDGSHRSVLVARGQNDEPDWSPDGSQIVFSQWIGHGRNDVFVINADGTGKTRLTDTPRRWEWTPIFSPDGLRIAFPRGRSGKLLSRGDIFTIAADGTDEQRLTDTRRIDEFALNWQAT